MKLQTERLELMSPHEIRGEALCAYYTGNRRFAQAYEPLREEAFYTVEHQQRALEDMIGEWEARQGYRFFICLDGAVIGTVALSNVVWGAFRSCFLGYGLDGRYVNRGYMTEALRRVIAFAFGEIALHRIEGNVMPGNLASRAVLEKCGFVCEGASRKYLKINGVWEDHLHYALLNESAE